MDYTTMTATQIRTAATEANVSLEGLDLRKKADKATAIARLEATVATEVAVVDEPALESFVAVVDAMTYEDTAEATVEPVASVSEFRATVDAITYEAAGTFGAAVISAVAFVCTFVLRTIRPQLNAMIRYTRKLVLTYCPVERYNGRWQVRLSQPDSLRMM